MTNKTGNKTIDFEIEFYEGVVKHSPDFVEALIALGDLYTKCGRIQEGLAVDLRLADLRAKDPVVFYNLACSYSLMNDLDKSLGALKKAVKLGYDDIDYMEADSDLDNLRADRRFKRIFSTLKKNTSKNAS